MAFAVLPTITASQIHAVIVSREKQPTREQVFTTSIFRQQSHGKNAFPANY
jgi:hypothetical protein